LYFSATHVEQQNKSKRENKFIKLVGYKYIMRKFYDEKYERIKFLISFLEYTVTVFRSNLFIVMEKDILSK
jgi:hypothetical protein